MKEKTRKYVQCLLCPKCPYWNECWEIADCSAVDFLVKVFDSLENLDSNNPDARVE